jgi:hypothetical protein
VKLCVIHDYRITLGCFGEQSVFKPPFKKPAARRMVVTFNGMMLPVTPGADDVCSLKPASSFDTFDWFSPQGTTVFPLQTGIYTAFVNINPPFARNPL